MINIADYEEDILIETSDFNMPVREILNLVLVKNREIKGPDRNAAAAEIIASLIDRGLVNVTAAKYTETEEDIYEPVSERELTPEELKAFLANHSKWDEMGVLSATDPYELAITDKGRKEYNSIAYH